MMRRIQAGSAPAAAPCRRPQLPQIVPPPPGACTNRLQTCTAKYHIAAFDLHTADNRILGSNSLHTPVNSMLFNRCITPVNCMLISALHGMNAKMRLQLGG